MQPVVFRPTIGPIGGLTRLSAKNKGENMGRYYPNAKEIVKNTTELGIFKLKEFGLLCGYAATTFIGFLNVKGA